ncbi:hypothetical protein [Brevundimonas subvibrioides]|uniref:hypothetical protein n=1 Tax=Brevundimonas subvibrioides TaxID=74313 RepID=UPI0022B31D65|nr:hypothetical protein [Brevundimonas subvibrioides]
MARVKAKWAGMGDDARLAKASRVASEAIRIVGLIKLVATLPEGRVRRTLKAEVDRQIETLERETA